MQFFVRGHFSQLGFRGAQMRAAKSRIARLAFRGVFVDEYILAISITCLSLRPSFDVLIPKYLLNNLTNISFPLAFAVKRPGTFS